MSRLDRDPLNSSDADFDVQYVPVEPGVRLRVLCWSPKMENKGEPLVFVAGWVSVVNGWAGLLSALVSDRPVYYIETREKSSAEILQRRLKPAFFSIDRMARDIGQAIKELHLDPSRTFLAGSSLGATTILESLKSGYLNAKGAFLIGPNGDFPAPLVMRMLIYLPAFSYHLVKYLVLWYLRHFRVDVQKEPEQMARYDATLRSAHPLRIKLSARAAAGYTLWDGLEQLHLPVALPYAPTDKLHDSKAIERMAGLLPQSELVACESNKYLHSEKLAREFNAFAAGLS